MAAGDVAVAFARAQIGKPYLWGATGPDAWDCSGLAQGSWKAAGVAIPRVTYTQIGVGAPVSQSQLALGDLVFPDAGHVQIYSGAGNVIEAPHAGASVREVPMWGFMAARRVGAPGTGQPGTSSPVPLNVGFGPDLSGIGKIGSTAAHIAGWITNPHNIWRLIEVFAGIALAIIGVGVMARDTIGAAAKPIAHVAELAAIA